MANPTAAAVVAAAVAAAAVPSAVSTAVSIPQRMRALNARASMILS